MKEIQRIIIAATLLFGASTTTSAQGYVRPHSEVKPAPATNVPIDEGAFKATEESLSDWQCPEWFRDVKFGIWAHWGPQCQAEFGDWYARSMYIEGDGKYKHHVETYGSPAEYGFKEMCRDFTVPDWNPEELIKLYKAAGARYFFTLGNHHDNMDLWDSPYQEWNSMNVGPGRDIVGGWAAACKKHGLRLGISFHASHAWMWYEPAQDFDGNLTKADGKGKWWEGYDPQALYAQCHPREQSGGWHWEWGGTSKPDMPYMMKFQNRTLQCINAYNPDIIYFDDTVLPFWYHNNQIGLNILQHFYNHSAAQHRGKQQVVATGKILKDNHKQFLMWDVERGVPDRIQEEPWQTCTCIGTWHYDRPTYERGRYKSAGTVIRMLVDVVSKNGNLLLSVPINRRGQIDEKERAIVEEIKVWMDINGKSIYGTRPWTTFGEGPLAEASNPLNAQGFNEGFKYSAADVRYVKKGKKLIYATIMQWPSTQQFTFKALGKDAKTCPGKVKSVKVLGAGKVAFRQDGQGLTITLPAKHPNEIAPVVEIKL
ncbi:MAG: alpha-L-fucosidase [Prevotella sp.]|nr:alpha-L-fucosidase [Prevotella sp.]